MVTLNPFTHGNPISDPKRFIGRRREVEQIFMRLRNPEFESSSIVGERRSGKTSLLNYISHPDAIRLYGLDPETFLFVYLDLEMITATSTPTRLYQYMLRRIASKVQDEALQKQVRDVSQYDTIDTYDLAEVLDGFEDRGLHAILLIDEFENVGGNPNFGPDFYYGLRSLAIHHDLALITATRLDLVEIAHSEEVRSSPFFNIFATINLRPLSEEDIEDMLDGYLEETGTSFGQDSVEHVLSLSGRVPFFSLFRWRYTSCSRPTNRGKTSRVGSRTWKRDSRRGPLLTWRTTGITPQTARGPSLRYLPSRRKNGTGPRATGSPPS